MTRQEKIEYIAALRERLIREARTDLFTVYPRYYAYFRPGRISYTILPRSNLIRGRED